MSNYISQMISSLNNLYMDVNLVYINSSMNEASIKASLSTLVTNKDNTIVIYYGANEDNEIFKELSDKMFIRLYKINTLSLAHELLVATNFNNPLNLNYLNKIGPYSYPITQFTEIIEHLLALLLKPTYMSKSLYHIKENNIDFTVSSLCI